MKFAKRLAIVAALSVLLAACAGAVIDTATDAAIAVAKTPFKVGGAVLDVVGDDD
ncbi:MAG: hypothetical protein ACU85V_17110 [Gammaproteobacteria bacterium]